MMYCFDYLDDAIYFGRAEKYRKGTL